MRISSLYFFRRTVMSHRHFKLVNSSGEELDLTSRDIFLHEPSGLGFEENNDFRQIGDFWSLNKTNRNQGAVNGTLIFTDLMGDDPYDLYWRFSQFILKTPLTLKYNPRGPIVEPEEGEPETYYRRTVRVSSLEKSEKDLTGCLRCAVVFSCYTPWFNAYNAEFIQGASGDDTITGWVWGDTGGLSPLIFEPSNQQEEDGAHRTQFGYESPRGFNITIGDIPVDCPIKLTIYGPLLNPSWTHSIITENDGETIETVIGSGGFNSSSTVTLADGDKLVIDGTSGSYAIYQINANGTQQDLYSKRDFGLPCFLSLKNGINKIQVSSSTGDFATHIEIERHVYYATV